MLVDPLEFLLERFRCESATSKYTESTSAAYRHYDVPAVAERKQWKFRANQFSHLKRHKSSSARIATGQLCRVGQIQARLLVRGFQKKDLKAGVVAFRSQGQQGLLSRLFSTPN